MSTLIRWNPTNRRRLMNEFDRLFEMPALWDEARNNWSLELDVAETQDGYVVKASVPGIDPENLDITMEDNVLAIKGEFNQEEEKENEQYYIRERRIGSFGRTVRFPVLVNSESIEAAYEKGVLTLTVPKAEEVKPKRITIKANGS
jgi:HSP20 family protein